MWNFLRLWKNNISGNQQQQTMTAVINSVRDHVTQTIRMWTVEQTAAAARKARHLSATCHRSLEVTENQHPCGENTNTISRVISTQSSLCLPSSPCEFPMALGEVNITDLYDIWHLQAVSTNRGCPFSYPRAVKHSNLCPLLFRYCLSYE